MAAGDTTGISGLRGSGNFRETITKEQPALGENNGGWTLFLISMKGDLSYYLIICHSKYPLPPWCTMSELVKMRFKKKGREKKKKPLNNPPKRGLNEVSFRGNELQFNTIIISDIKGLRIVSHAQKLFFFFFFYPLIPEIRSCH